jgi:AraC-like DNA-binding protein
MRSKPAEVVDHERAMACTNRFDTASAHDMHRHAHHTGQFILVETGTSHLYTEHGAWSIPAHRIAWVPPDVLHASKASGQGRGWVVIPPAELADLPSRVCMLRASGLLVSALHRLAQLPPRDHLSGLLWRVVAEEMRGAQPELLEVPLPSSPRLLKVAQIVLKSPTAAISLDQIAHQAGMSRRSFARHFRGQTGLSFTRWKRAVIAQHALELVALGHKISSVATDVGYESVSAFIAMFRRQYGESPRQFSIDRSERRLGGPLSP